MASTWNFERRRVVRGTFAVGVSLLVKGKPGAATSLEAVRSRMRLPPEDALFAARSLADEQMILFEPGGSVHSTTRGIELADTLVRDAVEKAQRGSDVLRTLGTGGVPLAMLKVAIVAHGGSLPCGAPEDGDARAHRLTSTGDEIRMERENPGGDYEPVEIG